MRGLALAVAIFFGVVATPSLANAYCCWNKAICMAVCGSPCCGSNKIATSSATRSQSLARMSDADLDKEAGRCDDAAPFVRMLKSEISERSAGSRTTAPMGEGPAKEPGRR